MVVHDVFGDTGDMSVGEIEEYLGEMAEDKARQNFWSTFRKIYVPF